MKQSTTLILAAALATGLAGVAAAAPQGPAVRASIDADGDGVITRAEAAARPRLAEHFDRLDADGDGRLERGERPMRGKGHGRHGGGLQRIVALDANGDGRIARVEASRGPLARHFDRLDANRDGYLVRGELEAGMERMRAERRGQREQKMREKFAQADRNRDGRLARDEVTQAMPRLERAFAFLDGDRDGFLSPQEIRFGQGRR